MHDIPPWELQMAVTDTSAHIYTRVLRQKHVWKSLKFVRNLKAEWYQRQHQNIKETFKYITYTIRV